MDGFVHLNFFSCRLENVHVTSVGEPFFIDIIMWIKIRKESWMKTSGRRNIHAWNTLIHTACRAKNVNWLLRITHSFTLEIWGAKFAWYGAWIFLVFVFSANFCIRYMQPIVEMFARGCCNCPSHSQSVQKIWPNNFGISQNVLVLVFLNFFDICKRFPSKCWYLFSQEKFTVYVRDITKK